MNLILEEGDPEITYKDEKGNSHTAKLSSLLKYDKNHPGFRAAQAAQAKMSKGAASAEPEDPYAATKPHTGLGGWRGSMGAEPSAQKPSAPAPEPLPSSQKLYVANPNARLEKSENPTTEDDPSFAKIVQGAGGPEKARSLARYIADVGKDYKIPEKFGHFESKLKKEKYFTSPQIRVVTIPVKDTKRGNIYHVVVSGEIDGSGENLTVNSKEANANDFDDNLTPSEQKLLTFAAMETSDSVLEDDYRDYLDGTNNSAQRYEEPTPEPDSERGYQHFGPDN